MRFKIRAISTKLSILVTYSAISSLMTQRQLFGTDGIRGKANVYPVTVEVMLALGRALGYWVKKGVIVIGKDTRISGYALEQALSAGICSMGVDVRF